MSSAFDKKVKDLLTSAPADPRLVPLAEEILEEFGRLAEGSETLRRYRETRKRMAGKPGKKKYTFSPPNFRYTLHTS